VRVQDAEHQLGVRTGGELSAETVARHVRPRGARMQPAGRNRRARDEPQPLPCTVVEPVFAPIPRLSTTMQIETSLTSIELQAELRLLYVERSLAELEGLAADAGYMDDLLDDIEAHKSAFMGVVVTEIATLRAELGGPLLG
jgi:hypothetical protein